MIQIKALAELMQEKLNAALNSTDEESPGYRLQHLMENVRFRFLVFPDVGDFVNPEREENSNTRTVYINALFSCDSVSAEGTTPQSFIGGLSAHIDFVVPLFSEVAVQNNLGAQNNARVCDLVRNVLTTTLQMSDTEDEISAGTDYYVTATYSVAMTGTRQDDAPGLGSCVTYTAYAEYAFIGNAVGYQDQYITVNGTRIYPQQWTAGRSAVQETNVKNINKDENETSYPTGKNITTSTQFVLSMTIPQRRDAFTDLYNAWLYEGKETPLSVQIHTVSADGVKKTYAYTMIFRNTDTSNQAIAAANLSATLVEYFD